MTVNVQAAWCVEDEAKLVKRRRHTIVLDLDTVPCSNPSSSAIMPAELRRLALDTHAVLLPIVCITLHQVTAFF